MARPLIKLLVAGTALSCATIAGAGLAGVTVHRVGGTEPWWKGSWMHSCLWDEECQSHGSPQRIYAFGLFVDFPRNVESRDISDDGLTR